MSYTNDTFVLPHPFTLQKPLFCLFPTDINFSLTFQWPSLWEVTLIGADGLLWLKWVGSSLFISLPVSSDALLWSFAPQFMSFHYISFCFDGCSCTPASLCRHPVCLYQHQEPMKKQRITAHLQGTSTESCQLTAGTIVHSAVQSLSWPTCRIWHMVPNASHKVWLKNSECIQRQTFPNKKLSILS